MESGQTHAIRTSVAWRLMDTQLIYAMSRTRSSNAGSIPAGHAGAQRSSAARGAKLR